MFISALYSFLSLPVCEFIFHLELSVLKLYQKTNLAVKPATNISPQ